MIKNFLVKGWIALTSDYEEDIEISDTPDKTYGKSLGGLLHEQFDELDFPSYSISFEDWTKGDKHFIDSVFLRYYIASKETEWGEIEKEHVRQLAGSMRVESFFDGYSEWTITDGWTDIFVGKHNLNKELMEYRGKFLLLKVSVSVNT